MGQDIFDVIIIVTLVIFVFRGLYRGFISEAAGIISLLVGFWAAKTYYGALESYLTFIADPGWRAVCACAILFLGAMIAVALAARLLKKVVSFSFASWADRLAGALLGLAKGIIIWGLLLIVIQKIFSGAEFIRNSRVIPYFNAFLQYVYDLLPPDLALTINL